MFLGPNIVTNIIQNLDFSASTMALLASAFIFNSFTPHSGGKLKSVRRCGLLLVVGLSEFGTLWLRGSGSGGGCFYYPRGDSRNSSLVGMLHCVGAKRHSAQTWDEFRFCICAVLKVAGLVNKDSWTSVAIEINSIEHCDNQTELNWTLYQLKSIQLNIVTIEINSIEHWTNANWTNLQ